MTTDSDINITKLCEWLGLFDPPHQFIDLGEDGVFMGKSGQFVPLGDANHDLIVRNAFLDTAESRWTFEKRVDFFTRFANHLEDKHSDSLRAFIEGYRKGDYTRAAWAIYQDIQIKRSKWVIKMARQPEKTYIVITEQTGTDRPPITETMTALQIHKAYKATSATGVMIIDGEVVKGRASAELPTEFL
jgi:hypothetical protein